jgi:cytochrome c oxidase assembly factor CtaG
LSSMMKMWISFASMGFMFFAILTIYFSRYKIKQKFLRFITAFMAYILMIAGGLMMIYIVFSGPTN